MILKAVCGMLAGAVLALCGGPSQADDYRPGEFLTLSLAGAALSPKPLGPPAYFESFPVQAKADPVPPSAGAAVAPVRLAKRRAPADAPLKLARKRGNPLDAQAFDPRIQVWPCRSGGICNWQKLSP